MNIVKRIFLFILVNFLIVTTFSFITSLLGVHGYLSHHGIDYHALAIFCLVWGMTGSIISLLLSRVMVKLLMGVNLVHPNTLIAEEKHLIHMVYSLARRLGLSVMPQVGIYYSDELNAFATGPTKNRALVAVSSGLLAHMTEDELEGVLAHEMSHVSNGDMVTMTLVQGIVNAFSLFLSRAMAYILSNLLSRNNNDRDRQPHITAFYRPLVFICDIFFTLLGSMVVAAFSRYREYRADRGGARLVGRAKMISALERLQAVLMPAKKKTTLVEPLTINKKGSRSKHGGFLSLLATHPDLELRIAALRNQ